MTLLSKNSCFVKTGGRFFENCWPSHNDPGANPHVLYRALVRGPQYESSDTISDRRDDFVESEVATDYNAGFQSTVAGLLSKAC